MKGKSLVSGALIIIALCAFMSHPPASYAQDPLVLCIYPYLSATEIYKRFTPLAGHIGRELGRPVKIRNKGSYDDYIDSIKKGEADIAFMGPATYVKFTKKFGRLHLLAAYDTNGNRTFKGIIVVHKDSRITKLSELRDKKFAFGDHNSTMGHLIPRYMLLKAGVDVRELGKYEFLSHHENVALGVLTGSFDAGAVREEVYNQYSKEGLRALAISGPVPDHLFVARAGLPEDTVRKISKILLSLKDTEEGRKVLGHIQKNLTALVTVRDADYDSLRKIIERLAQAGVEP
ncbi:MAG: phosphate/phosphite/phosphonate ABC transporter substrate-binding protein [Nitrospirae bacterium]|nr:MAG: phosphate/phosphite/phosphonate ABC transporter substrate-binding protein [Nitrospirota bacterium]